MHHYAVARLLALVASAPLFGAPPRIDPAAVPLEEYAQRRDTLRQRLPEGLIVLAGATESERGDLRSGFVQEPNFFYLTGWREPGAMLVLAPERQYFFLPAHSAVRERYTGRKLAPGDPDVSALTGFPEALPAESWRETFRELAARDKSVYTLDDERLKSEMKVAAEISLHDLSLPLARLRMVKSQREIALIQAATDASIEAHLAAWRRVSPGLFEYQIAATMTSAYFERGCERNAYPPIVASGPVAVILHYNENRRRMDRGELLLMDVGAECAGYAADLTRTIPVNGRFSARQRELYEIVLGAQKAAIAAAKPGMKLRGSGENSLEQIAQDYINANGKDRNGEPLGKYFTHGLGHHVGLQVHDATDPAVELAPGMVVTIEPGLYIPEESTGIRIEDMILITADGATELSSALPKETGEIESYLRRKR